MVRLLHRKHFFKALLFAGVLFGSGCQKAHAGQFFKFMKKIFKMKKEEKRGFILDFLEKIIKFYKKNGLHFTVDFSRYARIESTFSKDSLDFWTIFNQCSFSESEDAKFNCFVDFGNQDTVYVCTKKPPCNGFRRMINNMLDTHKNFTEQCFSVAQNESSQKVKHAYEVLNELQNAFENDNLSGQQKAKLVQALYVIFKCHYYSGTFGCCYSKKRSLLQDSSV